MSADNKAVREAFVAYMATVGVTGVVWTAELGPMGTRHHKSTLLSVAWMDFAAGYAAAIAAEREACAKVCDERECALRIEANEASKSPLEWSDHDLSDECATEASQCAAAIRARGAS